LARFLALDWDHKQLHLVVVTTGRGGAEIQRALVWQEGTDPIGGQPEALGQRLRAYLRGAGIAAAPVLACVGRDRVILKEIRYPQVPASEEPAVVRFQASKEMTDAAEDVVIDYTPLDEPGSVGERRAIAVIVRRKIVAAYQALCKAAGLKLACLIPRPFAIAAALQRIAGAAESTPAPQSPDAVSAVLTVAEGWAEFCIVRGTTLLFARSLAVGNNLAAEVRRNLTVYAGQPQVSLARDVVRAVYVAGNGEEKALREHLQELLAIPVHALDLFALDAHAEVSPGSRAGFAGGVGLAHLWALRTQAPINFVRVKEPVAKADPHRNRKLLAAGAVAALFVLAGVWGFHALAAKRAAIDALTAEKSRLDDVLLRLAPDAKHVQALREWDDGAVSWLDELYDLTARFPYREGLRVTQLTAGPVTNRNPKDKDKTTVRMTVTGIAPREDDRYVQQLLDEIKHDKHLRADMPGLKSSATVTATGPGAAGNRKALEEFSLRIEITKQKPRDYQPVLTPPPAPPPQRGRFDPEEGDDDLGAVFQGGRP
jgi:hypothetical protein